LNGVQKRAVFWVGTSKTCLLPNRRLSSGHQQNIDEQAGFGCILRALGSFQNMRE